MSKYCAEKIFSCFVAFTGYFQGTLPYLSLYSKNKWKLKKKICLTEEVKVPGKLQSLPQMKLSQPSGTEGISTTADQSPRSAGRHMASAV